MSLTGKTFAEVQTQNKILHKGLKRTFLQKHFALQFSPECPVNGVAMMSSIYYPVYLWGQYWTLFSRALISILNEIRMLHTTLL